MSKCRVTLGLLALGFAALAVSPAAAQTTANGPYYAVPSWDQTLPSSTRFIVLSNLASAAVLDRETGLVWDRAPGAGALVWEDAMVFCNDQATGGRMAWRLPTFQELASLVDPAIPFGTPKLPVGHPFVGVQAAEYWSATSTATTTPGAWAQSFGTGSRRRDLKTQAKLVWCVRGGQGVDPQ
jgi:uncharacterized protein DUF1566